jgi:hypothetical protein
MAERTILDILLSSLSVLLFDDKIMSTNDTTDFLDATSIDDERSSTVDAKENNLVEFDRHIKRVTNLDDEEEEKTKERISVHELNHTSDLSRRIDLVNAY